MTQPRITIIGLGLIGGSIGLALKASDTEVYVVGHDIDSGRGRLAQKKGAVDKSTVNLPNACQDADLVVIATPINAIHETLEVIAPHLKGGCVVTDTATLKEPVLAWAAETLPPGISFVGGDPMLNPAAQPTDLMVHLGLESARADLFQGALYALCLPAEAAPTAAKRVTDMVNLIGARPFYMDPTEHDGMRASVEGLPALVSLALMQQVAGSPGWREARKLADHVFGMATAPLAGDAAAQRAQLLLNAAYLLPCLDALIDKLSQLRAALTTQDAAALEGAFGQATAVRDRWLADRALSRWEEELGELEITGTMGSLGRMLGLSAVPQKPKEE
jgi:prephenate dehydrogenase